MNIFKKIMKILTGGFALLIAGWLFVGAVGATQLQEPFEGTPSEQSDNVLIDGSNWLTDKGNWLTGTGEKVGQWIHDHTTNEDGTVK